MLGYRSLVMGQRSWWEAPGYVICCIVAWYVGHLSKKGLLLNRRITSAIRDRKLSWLQMPQQHERKVKVSLPSKRRPTLV